MRGYELSDFEWCVIAPLLPNKPRRAKGRRSSGSERNILGLATGALWRALPTEFGPSTTCYNRFVRWRKAGVWDRILAAVTIAYDGNVQIGPQSSAREVAIGALIATRVVRRLIGHYAYILESN